MEKHNISRLFERLCTALVYYKPEDPKKLLIEELENMKHSGQQLANLSKVREGKNAGRYMHAWMDRFAITVEQIFISLTWVFM